MTLLTQKTETGEVEILKTDTLGRVWTPRAKREALVAEFERSAMSAAEFAKWSGVKYATFANWVAKGRKARRRASEEETPPKPGVMRWAEAVVEERPSGAAASVVIQLGSAIRVETRDGRVAAELLSALGVRVC